MGRKLIDIKNNVKESSNDFDHFFRKKLPSISTFIDSINKDNNVYLFSGILRDYFLNKERGELESLSIRDVDLVVEDIESLQNYSKYIIKKNSFGGLKLEIGGIIVDIWELNNTWAFKQKGFKCSLFHELDLLDSTFFNSSSIIFNFKEKSFIFNDEFIKFLYHKKLNIVFEDNPSPELCIINTLYYSRTKNLKISNKLKKYINYHISQANDKLTTIQIKHFGKILYTQEAIDEWINNIK